MSATDNIALKNDPQYVAVINALVEKDTALAEKNVEIAELRKEIDKLHRIIRSARFGVKSERVRPTEENPNQQLLFTVELPAAKPQTVEETIKVAPHQRRARKRYTDKDGLPSHFPPHLERRDTVLTPEGSTTCEDCGAEKERISQVVSEKLQVIPAQYFVERINKVVLSCKCCKDKAPEKAASPDSVLPVSVLGKSFITSSLTQKFGWHIPFYRQSQMLSQLGIEIQRDVLINTAIKVGNQLKPIVRQMAKEICEAELVHIDETPCVVGINEGGKTKFKTHSYFWPILADGMVVFIYTGNRRHHNVKDILGADFKGIVMSDGYEAYHSYAVSNPYVTLALCWDHARRRFFEISDTDELANEAVDRIGYFYKVERDIKELGLKVNEIPGYRKRHVLPQLNDLLDWCKKLRDKSCLLPKSKLLEAVSYVINHWDGLTVYLEHGMVPISNIIIEQQIRNLKLGAKNWLFAASEVGAETVAIFNSLVCTCRINGINIFEYLNDILGCLDTKPASQLTPKAWAREQLLKKGQEAA